MKKVLLRAVSAALALILTAPTCFTAFAEGIDAAERAMDDRAVIEGVEEFLDRNSLGEFLEDAAEKIENGIENRAENEAADEDANAELFSEGSYETVRDINTVDELLAIDGVKNGYFTLCKDLDISGMEWKPIELSGSVFDGGGHTISGLTITDAESSVQSEYYYLKYLGLFYGDGSLHVQDLRVTNVDIDITAPEEGNYSYRVSPIGEETGGIEGCYVQGRIKVSGDVYAAALSNGSNSTADVDIEASDGAGGRAMDSCVDCTFNGDINSSGETGIYGVNSCAGCTFNGNINFWGNTNPVKITSRCSVEAIASSESSVFNGNINILNVSCEGSKDYLFEAGKMTASAMSGCGNCAFYGNINVDNINISAGEFEINGASNCGNCGLYGNITAKNINLNEGFEQIKNGVGIYICGISGGDGCTFSGNITAEVQVADESVLIYGCEVCGIRGNNSSFIGDMNVKYSGDAYISQYCHCNAIANSENSGFYGNMNVTSETDGNVNCYWISGSVNCVFEGDVHENGSGTIRVIDNAKNCTVRGNLYLYNMRSDDCVLYESQDCSIYGNIVGTIKKDSVSIMDCCDNCFISGNIDIDADLFSSLYVITDSQSCLIKGDVTVSNGNVYGICARARSFEDSCCFTCVIEGNISSTADGRAYGIYGSGGSVRGCVIKGNISAKNGGAYGIYGDGVFVGNSYKNSTIYGCVIEGNVSTTNGTAYGIYGFRASVSDSNYENSIIYGCVIEGNVSTTNGTAYGIDCAVSGNSIGGSVIGSLNGYTGSVTAASKNYAFILECESCKTRFMLNTDYNYYYHDYEREPGVHCCYYTIFGFTMLAPLDVIDALAIYAVNPESSGSSSGSVKPTKPVLPEEPTAQPEPPKASYALQIIDLRTNAPLDKATVTVDGKSYTSDKNGIVNLTNVPRVGLLKIEYGGAVVHSEARFAPIPNTINTVYVNGISLSADDINLGNSAGVVVNGPKIALNGKETPVFRLPLNFELDFFNNLGIAYDKDENIYQVIVSFDKDKDKKPGESDNSGKPNKIEDANSPAWKKAIEEANFEFEIAKNHSLDISYDSGGHDSLGIEGELAAKLIFELQPTNEGLKLVSGNGFIKFEGSYSSAIPIPSVQVVYIAFGVEGEFLAEAKLVLKESSTIVKPDLDLSSKISMNFTPSLGIGAGVKGRFSGEVGFKGSLDGELNLPMEKLSDSFLLTLTGKMYVQLVLLLFKIEYNWDFVKMELYPNFGTYLQSISADDLENYELIDRSYLKNPEVSLFAADGETVKNNVYPYGEVQTVTVGGKVLMVWLDDDTSRSLADKTALYYSVLENGKWSKPEMIENDGTADFAFDLKSDGENAAILWQDTGKKFGERTDTEALVKDMAKNMSLSYAEFKNGEWSAPTAAAKADGKFKYAPSLCYRDGFVSAAWLENASGELLPKDENDKVNVFTSAQQDGAFQTPEKNLENIAYVYELAALPNGGAAIIADADGNIETRDSVVLFDGEVCYTSDEYVMCGLTYTPDGNWVMDGNRLISFYTSSHSTVAEIPQAENALKVKYLTSNYNSAVVFELQNEFSSNLYASYNEGGWTAPVPITDYDERIRSWDAQIDKDGNISIGAVLADVQMEGDELSDASRLIYTMTEPKYDIVLNSVALSDIAAPGKTAEFILNVTNISTYDDISLNVEIQGEYAELYNGVVNTKIPASGSGNVPVRVMIPEGFKPQTVTASVSVDGVSETDMTNNTASVAIEGGNLSLEMTGYKLKTTGALDVTVENTGIEAVSGATLTVRAKNGDTIYTEKLGTVNGGEKRKISVDVDEKYYVFDDENESGYFTAEITGGDKELFEYDNRAKFSTSVTNTIRAVIKKISLKKGAKYKAGFKVYPEENAFIYYQSDAPEVASIDENGVVTALSEGVATITAMTPGAPVGASMKVYVKGDEMSQVEITSVDYTRYEEYGGYVYGDLVVATNLSGCLMDGEKATLIVLAYAEDGTLIGIATKEVSGGGSEYSYIPIEGKAPAEVKAMLWESASSLKPAALPADASAKETAPSEPPSESPSEPPSKYPSALSSPNGGTKLTLTEDNIEASQAPQSDNPPSSVLDGNKSTFWASFGDGILTVDLGELRDVTCFGVAMKLYEDYRTIPYDVEVSTDGTKYETVFEGSSTPRSDATMYIPINSSVRYIRFTAHGNTVSWWNSVAEIEVYAN